MSIFNLYLSTLKLKGNLAFEYNPFHNYLTSEDLYEVSTNVGRVLCPVGKAVDKNTGNILTNKGKNDDKKWVDKFGNVIKNENVIKNGTLYAKAGSLIDLDTEQLNFDLEHPVDIEVLPSYDGSVNLILNDDKNIPKLINSRFSVREKNTYEIVDRIGENDTNIYSSKSFDKDTSLYYQYEKNPEIKFLGLVDGRLPVGSYCFYFTYCDADDNESDYIAETGIIPVFIGDDKNPNSMDGGIKNQNSVKGIKLRLKNIDSSYNYIRVYYIRYFADYNLNKVCELKKIHNKISVNSSSITLIINGNEQTEDLDPDILNITKFNPKSVLTQAQCKNILFFGNIVKNTDNYRELTDCALRIIPKINNSVLLNFVDNNYLDLTNDYGYYSSKNMYNYTGYFDLEYYRFGVVFIYLNGTLSNVYNTLGLNISELNVSNKPETFSYIINLTYYRKYIPITEDGWIDNPESYYTIKPLNDVNISLNNVNARGVCKLDYSKKDNKVLGITFSIPQEVCSFLKEELGIRGMFFVRQKCYPTILAQCHILNMDEQLEAPVLTLKEGNKTVYQCETFISQEKQGGGLVVNDYNERLYKYEDKNNSISKNAYAGICPDFLLNQPYYNQIFNGSTFYLLEVDPNLKLVNNGNRIYSLVSNGGDEPSSNGLIEVKICSVTDAVSTVALENKIYRLEIGETEEAFRFKYVDIDSGNYNAGDEDFDKINSATNVVRGKYSPYLAIYSNKELKTTSLYNIYLSRDIHNIYQQYTNRMDSRDPYYAISDRFNFEDLTINGNKYLVNCYRGDCFYNQFTYRLNRNFNDPSLPNNDDIIDRDTWKNNYDVANPEKWKNISRSDINAVLMGSWITFKVKSSMNYALRSLDHSYVSEEALMGNARSFYPKSKMMWRGENKMPDSYLYNDAFRSSLGYKCYFALQDINYIKNNFSNRIQYSSIAILDSFKNNYRDSLSTYFRDYSLEYGSILKLLEYHGNLLVVFEHGIGIAVINERILAGEGEGNPVFVNTKNVLPEELTIITNTYGTQWPESVVKTEAGYVYGVDTISKKIWKVSGQQLEIISDFKVNKFLVDNITLGERELYPVIGLKNVKTHYNNNKKDIMFTFYDDVYLDEEKVWNLCYNELLGQFTTFYSWLPSYSENIDTLYFSFNRETSKWLSLLRKSNYYIESNLGILVDFPILNNKNTVELHYRPVNTYSRGYEYVSPNGKVTYKKDIYTEKEFLNNQVYFEIKRDHWGYYKEVTLGEGRWITINNMDIFKTTPVVLLEIAAFYKTDMSYDNIYLGLETIAITTKEIIQNNGITKADRLKLYLTTDFYLHGKSGIFSISEDLYPTHWYGQYHPFEFEFVVNDKIGLLKIFTDLVLISNKAEPESFHFEIEGDNYEFSNDKRTMYFRQEATKELYQNLGSDILFNRYYTDVAADEYTYELYYRSSRKLKLLSGEDDFLSVYDYNGRNIHDKCIGIDKVYPVYSHGLVKLNKSTIFPLYYERIDTYNDIYHKYHLMKDDDGVYDFLNLSGSEISWDRDLNQFNIITHIKNSPIDYVGRLRGNSRYKEGKWNIQIPPIIFMLKNEQWLKGNTPTTDNAFILSCDNVLGSLLCGDDVLVCGEGGLLYNNQFIIESCDGNSGSELCGDNVLGCGELQYSGNEFLIESCDGTSGSELCGDNVLGCNGSGGDSGGDSGSGGTSIDLPPIVINSQYIPKDLDTTEVSSDRLPHIYSKYGYNIGAIEVDKWHVRKETKIRDKWIKIRIRYSGKNLAVIHSIATLYNLSYS